MDRTAEHQQKDQPKKQWHRPELEEIPVQATAFKPGPGDDGMFVGELAMSGAPMALP